MKFFSQTPNFDFMAQRKLALLISAVLIIASIVSLPHGEAAAKPKRAAAVRGKPRRNP